MTFSHNMFNADWYLARNPDVAAAVAAGQTTAYDHFINHGASEARSPLPVFDVEFYLQQNPDVRAAVENGDVSAVGHFLAFGQNEGRYINPFIDLGAYLNANPDVGKAVADGAISALAHLLQYGLAEGRDLGNGIDLGIFAGDPKFQAAQEAGNAGAALGRVAEVAPFLPSFEPPPGWAAPANTPIPLNFIPPAGITLVVPPSVTVPPGMILPDTFAPVAPVTPVAPGGGVTTSPTFTATVEAGVLTFGGTATGDITFTSDGEGLLTFWRGGLHDTVPVTDEGSITKITVASGQTLSATAAQVDGAPIDGAGTVAITALNATPGANLGNISANTVTVNVAGDVTFTGSLGAAAVTIASGTMNVDSATINGVATFSVSSGATLAGTAAKLNDITATGTGSVDVSDLAAGSDLSGLNATLTVTAAVAGDINISSNASLGTVDAYTLEWGSSLTLTAAQAAGKAISGYGGVVINGLAADTDLSGITFSATVRGVVTETADLTGADLAKLTVLEVADGAIATVTPQQYAALKSQKTGDGTLTSTDTIAPTVTTASATYDASSNTLTITGSSFDTLLEPGETDTTDIKDRLDWTKLVWDINGDGATTANVGFAVNDIHSALVSSGTTLTIKLSDAKGVALEGTAGYGADSGNDTLRIEAGFARDLSDNAATTDELENGTIAITADNTAPTITGVTSTVPNSIYKVGTTLSIQITFSEPVFVEGNPQLTLETGTADAKADYSSGNGTNTLTFFYLIRPGEISPDLDYAGASALALNGGSIKDSAGNDALLTLPEPGAPGSLGFNKAIVIDGVAPTISAVTIPDQAMKIGDVVTATIRVDNAAGEMLALKPGSTIGGFTLGDLAKNSDTEYTATFTITSGGTDVAAGGNVPVSIRLVDPVGNESTLFSTAISQDNDRIDANAPTLADSIPADDATGIQASGDIVLTFKESVAKGSAGTIRIFKASDDSEVASYDVSGDISGNVSFDPEAHTVTINPTADLDGNTGYYVQITPGAIVDGAGNPYAGITDATTLNFNTAATFTATLENGVITFGGSATGDISVRQGVGNVTFTRGGIDATALATTAVAENGIPAAGGSDKLLMSEGLFNNLKDKLADGAATINGAVTVVQAAVTSHHAKIAEGGVTAITYANEAAVETANDAIASLAIANDAITLTAGSITTAKAAVLANLDKFKASAVSSIELTKAEATAATLGNDALANASVRLGDGEEVDAAYLAAVADVVGKFQAGTINSLTLAGDTEIMAVAAAIASPAVRAWAISLTDGAITDATAAAAVAANLGKFKANSVTSITLTGEQFVTANSDNLWQRYADSAVSISGRVSESTQAASVLGLRNKIAENGIEGITLSYSQWSSNSSNQLFQSSLNNKLKDGSSLIIEAPGSFGSQRVDALAISKGVTITNVGTANWLTGGVGHDTFVINASSTFTAAPGLRIEGGEGTDVLKITGTGAINLSAANTPTTSVETLDLTDVGNQNLTLTATQFNGFTTINADATDKITITALNGAAVAATDAIDTFKFAESDANVVISGFTVGAGNDVLDFSALVALNLGLKGEGVEMDGNGIFDAFLTAGAAEGGTDIAGKVFVVSDNFGLAAGIVTDAADNALYLANEAKAIALVADTDDIATATSFTIKQITGSGGGDESIQEVGTVGVSDPGALSGANFLF